MSELRNRKQRKALATIYGAASFSLSLLFLSQTEAMSQSPSADLEAVEAVEVPIIIQKQGPICGKLELRPLPANLESSSSQKNPVKKTATPVRSASTATSTNTSNRASIYSPADNDLKGKQNNVVEFERQLKSPEPAQRAQPTKSTAHVQEFNWLSDEPVSQTAEKFATQAKRESAKSAKASKAQVQTQIQKAGQDPDQAPAEAVTESAIATPSRSQDSDNAGTSTKKVEAIDPGSVKVAIKPHCSGVADFYARRFHGLKTASGQIHDKEKFTAAHRTLPFGTKLKVVNRHTGKACVVTVNDRGPFTPSRVIDLSEAAAKELGLITAKSRMVDCYLVENP